MSVAALVASAAPARPAPGQETETRGADSAVDAARAYLEGRGSRYRIADARRDLIPAGTVTSGDEETVRLRQRHRGVPVLGGEYVVRMEKNDGARVVTGVSGRYFTGLRTGATAEVGEGGEVGGSGEVGEGGEKGAVDRAVDAVRRDLGALHPALKGVAHGLVVLPTGSGVLTRHITVTGSDAATGTPVLREVYVDVHTGRPLLQYSGIRTFAPAGTGTHARLGGADDRRDGTDVRRDSADARGDGTDTRLDGTHVKLEVDRDAARGVHVLRDRTRIPTSEDGLEHTLSVWDARGKRPGDVAGQWPADIQEFASPTPEFGRAATEAGAVDAHWAAAQVHDYYKKKHGRSSLDGHGMTINSVVGVAGGGQPGADGQPGVNAFWDGDKVVYGTGDAEHRPAAAGLDVVGHEMTHAVVEHSARLVHAGQPGAMDEAFADYFGNSIENGVHKVPDSDPDAGLVGERLCRTKTPRACAVRDLNDGRTTATLAAGAGAGADAVAEGMHLNSTVFSGALWDARKELGADLTDTIVYQALTRYLTPLDGFTEGRAAVLAAAKDLGVPAAAQKKLARAFAAHGIVPGWERALGVDCDPLLGRPGTVMRPDPPASSSPW
ncbi:M4 family metallopeptidase [Streptomyces sp. NPDC059009]|uniref:M4 family metallopeptidase n=1 Tax=Streptomyces sp. NPDC059009 TaxID=3346694 RepID=UPI00367C0E65